MDSLSNISTIKQIMEKHGFAFSKAMGQNFLINPSICPKMAEYGVIEGGGVLEIGPGIGVLTNELAKSASKVVAVELDKRLIPILDETLSDHDNIIIINDDILNVDIHELLKNNFDGLPVSVCANLPYYITSPVIMHLLEQKLDIDNITVMIQYEAAQRICAQPGTRLCGAVTAAVWYYSQPELLFKVSAGSFMPAPKVDSAVVRLNIRKAPPVKVLDEKFFFKIIKGAFGQRRKTFVNSVSALCAIPKADVALALDACGIAANIRAEQLTLEQLAAVSDELYKSQK